VKDFSREDSRVLMRLDPSSVDLKNPNVHRTDGDFPQAWARMYGKGRVFVCAFGHDASTWEKPEIRTMWLEALKWALGMTEADVTPRPKSGGEAPHPEGVFR
jgi:type 1 glutamine amidotransferase